MNKSINQRIDDQASRIEAYAKHRSNMVKDHGENSDIVQFIDKRLARKNSYLRKLCGWRK